MAQEQAAENDEAKEDNNNHNDPQGGSSDTENAAEKAVPAEPQANQGILILDATCIPADIKYPTDLGLLNEARKKLEEIIDTLHSVGDKKGKKTRTYRQKARKACLSISKQRSPRKIQLRQGIKRQLQYCKRNLCHVDQLLKYPLERML